MDKKNETGLGISKITLCGFKSFLKEQSIDIFPLTILAGTNSSGKSSIMQPLLLMKQTLEASYDPGALLLNGPHVRFTSTEQMLSRNSRGAITDTFSIGGEIRIPSIKRKIPGDNTSVETSPRKTSVFFQRHHNKPGFHIKEMVSQSYRNEISLTPHMTSDQIHSILFREQKQSEGNWTIERDRCFLNLFQDGRPFSLNLLRSPIRHMIHLPGLRGAPERNYPTTAVDEGKFSYPGPFQAYTASVVHYWQESNNVEKLQGLQSHLRLLGLADKVETKQINDTEIAVYVGRTLRTENDQEDLVSIADVGLGVSQTLPVAVALLLAEPGQMVYIEQPELHLHPRAQYEMARLLADAAKRGVKVVIETHSSLLLRGIQTLVANDEFSPDLVKLHWFTRNPQDGSTEITSADLNQNGAFGDWPEDFGDIEMTAEMRYLDAVEKRGKRNGRNQ